MMKKTQNRMNQIHKMITAIFQKVDLLEEGCVTDLFKTLQKRKSF